MTTQATKIQDKLTGGYRVIEEVNHKSSYYFYISNPDSVNSIKVRVSDHDAICVASRSHIQVIESCGLINFQLDNINEGIEDLSMMLGMDISSFVYEVGRGDVTLNFGNDWQIKEEVIAAWVATKIMDVNINRLY